MNRLARLFGFGLSLFILSGVCWSHEDAIAPLVRVDKVFDAPKPLGRIRVAYSAGDAEPAKPSLRLACDAFKEQEVPAEGLADLPRPEWGGLTVPYSLTSFDAASTRRFVDRPYLYIQIPVHGPTGEAWSNTWVIFMFDANGKLTERSIKQFVPEGKIIRVLSEPWPIGKNITAADVLNAARDRE